MSKAREIKRRIKSVTNTRQITRTMEMVASAKIKKAQERIEAARPYALAMMDTLRNVAKYVPAFEHPLLENRPVENVAILVMTSNRGLCGSFNTNILRQAENLAKREIAEGKNVRFIVVGKKGLSYLNYREYEVYKSYIGVSDEPSFGDARESAENLVSLYMDGKIDKAYLVFNRFKSVMEQYVVEYPLLPIGHLELNEDEDEGAPEKALESMYIFEPDSAADVMSELLPAYAEYLVFRALLESTASEQGARRTAMMAATENAKEMITDLTRDFNRVRQAAITMEIAEIVGGAEALETGS